MSIETQFKSREGLLVRFLTSGLVGDYDSAEIVRECQRMADDGLVTVSMGPHTGTGVVRLTEKGRALAEAAKAAGHKADE